MLIMKKNKLFISNKKIKKDILEGEKINNILKKIDFII